MKNKEKNQAHEELSGLQITKIVAIFGKKKLLLQTAFVEYQLGLLLI